MRKAEMELRIWSVFLNVIGCLGWGILGWLMLRGVIGNPVLGWILFFAAWARCAWVVDKAMEGAYRQWGY